MLRDRDIYDGLIESSENPAICQQLVNLDVPVDIACQLADTGRYESQTVIIYANEKATALVNELDRINFWD